RAFGFNESTPCASLHGLVAVTARLFDGYLVVRSTIHDEQIGHAWDDPVEWRGTIQGGIAKISRRRWNLGQIVETAEQYRANHAARTRRRQQRGEICARVFAEQHQPVRIDFKFPRAAANEKQCRPRSASASSWCAGPPSR